MSHPLSYTLSLHDALPISATYIRMGEQVDTHDAAAIPAGLFCDSERIAAESGFVLEAGAWLLMQTDGLCAGESEEKLEALLRSYKGNSPAELAQLALALYADERGEDDATVIVLHLEARR